MNLSKLGKYFITMKNVSNGEFEVNYNAYNMIVFNLFSF